MPEPNRTPGPWRTHDAGSQGVFIMPDCADKRERSRYIAIVNGRDATVDRANARLIAQVPSLYAALETCAELPWVHNALTTATLEDCRRVLAAHAAWWNRVAVPALAKADGRDA